MDPRSRDSYLQTAVLSASPQKRQLMLIEGALRFANRGRQCWQEGRDAEANLALTRSTNIVAELICALDPTQAPDLVRRVADLYRFIFDSLAAAQLHRDESKLAEAVRILEIERGTWQQLCSKLGQPAAPLDTPEMDHPGFTAAV